MPICSSSGDLYSIKSELTVLDIVIDCRIAIMGAYQSKVSVQEKVVIDRLRALQVEGGGDEDYVCVSKEAAPPVSEKTVVGSRQPEALSVPLVEKWQDTLLSDPKNRCV